jgi:hypothetical protein
VNSPIIVNMDDYYAHEMNHPTVWRYGLFGDFDVCSTRVMLSPRGADFTLTTPKGPVDIRLKAAGIHNVYNAMAACTWGISEGIALDDIQHGLVVIAVLQAAGERHTLAWFRCIRSGVGRRIFRAFEDEPGLHQIGSQARQEPELGPRGVGRDCSQQETQDEVSCHNPPCAGLRGLHAGALASIPVFLAI